MTLLIVDDHAQTREIMKTLLAGLFDKVFECSNGAQAMASFALNDPDWTLMDIEMPVCDGIEATRLIRESSPNARIVILTAHDSVGLRMAARQAGAYAYVLKDDLSILPTILNEEDKARLNKAAAKAIAIVSKDD